MKHFLKVSSGANIVPMLLQVQAHEELWSQKVIGALWADQFPSIEVMEILPRYTQSIDDLDDLQCFWREEAQVLHEVRTFAVQLAGVMKADQVGRVMLTRLPMDRSIPTHADIRGAYASFYQRFHVPLVSSEGTVFHCGGESLRMSPGEIWWTDVRQPHAVVNDSYDARVNLIIDLHIP
jgi:Aspartyl/Asparaginyl beta-hydroxylase